MKWHDATVVIKSLYGMDSPSQESVIKREKKVKQLIKVMGDKYLLAKKMERLV